MYCKLCIFLRQMGYFRMMAIAVLFVAVNVPAVSAEEKRNENSGWEFRAAPYLWFISMDGDVKVKGQKSDVDASFSDIWDELNVAAMVAFEGRKDRWGFFGDIIYANLGNTATVGRIRIEPDINALWLTAGGFYRLGTWGLSDASTNEVSTVTVDVFAGARYTYLDMELDFKNLPLPDVSADKDWVDPLIGTRAIFDLSERWALSLDGSIGGFGVGSDFAWNAAGLIGYRFGLFGKDNATVFGGYRAMYQDYTDGSGNDEFEWDVTLHGPILGLAIQF